MLEAWRKAADLGRRPVVGAHATRRSTRRCSKRLSRHWMSRVTASSPSRTSLAGRGAPGRRSTAAGPTVSTWCSPRSRHGSVRWRYPDTGCTLCDLNEGINVFVATFRRIHPDVLGALLADCAADSHLRAAFMTTLFDPPRAAVAHMLDRSINRGDICGDIDRTLILDMLGSLVHYRAVFDHAPISDLEVERAVEVLMRGIATDCPKLLAHSRRISGDPQVHPAHT